MANNSSSPGWRRLVNASRARSGSLTVVEAILSAKNARIFSTLLTHWKAVAAPQREGLALLLNRLARAFRTVAPRMTASRQMKTSQTRKPKRKHARQMGQRKSDHLPWTSIRLSAVLVQASALNGWTSALRPHRSTRPRPSPEPTLKTSKRPLRPRRNDSNWRYRSLLHKTKSSSRPSAQAVIGKNASQAYDSLYHNTDKSSNPLVGLSNQSIYYIAHVQMFCKFALSYSRCQPPCLSTLQ